MTETRGRTSTAVRACLFGDFHLLSALVRTLVFDSRVRGRCESRSRWLSTPPPNVSCFFLTHYSFFSTRQTRHSTQTRATRAPRRRGAPRVAARSRRTRRSSPPSRRKARSAAIWSAFPVPARGAPLDAVLRRDPTQLTHPPPHTYNSHPPRESQPRRSAVCAVSPRRADRRVGARSARARSRIL